MNWNSSATENHIYFKNKLTFKNKLLGKHQLALGYISSPIQSQLEALILYISVCSIFQSLVFFIK